MKKLINIITLAAIIICLSACHDDTPATPTLDVTPANLDGVWQLVQWNGAPVPSGTYLYVEFSRRERTFGMWQKFDSMYARHITGTFSIETTAQDGSVISGTYDHGRGPWNSSYTVTDLTPSGTMTWTSTVSPDDVSVYQRVDSIPQEILDEAQGHMQ